MRKTPRMAKRDILRMADINATTATSATYFPFAESMERIAYSCGTYGWTANLFRGMTSGRLYAVTDMGNEDAPLNWDLYESLGNREKTVLQTLDHVEETEHDGAEHSVIRFVANDNSAFSVATWNYGKTWIICG